MNAVKFKVGSASEFKIDINNICKFYRDNWKRRLALEIPSFYKWQFIDCPENEGKDFCCVAIDEDKKILGIMGLNRRSFLINGNIHKAAELTTWVVSEKERGLGIGKKIMEYLQKNYDVLMGMGISESALFVYLSNGFKYLRYIPRYVRVYNQNQIAPHSKITPLGEFLIKKYKNSPQKNKYKFEQVKASDLGCLLEGLEDNKFNLFVRNKDILKWRYDNHPVFKYETFIARDSGIGIGIVIRVDVVDEMKIVHVLDCFGDLKDIYSALSFIDDYCNENKVSVSDFYCTSEQINRYFRYYGWLSVIDDYYFQFIHLFHPPELRIPSTTSLVYWSKFDMDKLNNLTNLYITKEDLDLDRPTFDYISNRLLNK
jgi:hypothetical protein